MNIFEYVKSLATRTEKDKVMEDLRVTQKEFSTLCIPTWQIASDYFRGETIRSKDVNGILKEALNTLKTHGVRQPNGASAISVLLVAASANLETLIKVAGSTLSTDTMNDGINSKNAVIIRIAEYFSFLSRYSVDLLNYLYAYESAAIGSNRSDKLYPSKMSQKKVEANLSNFLKLLNAYGVPNNEFQRSLDKTPSILISVAKKDLIESTYADTQLDSITPPIISGFIGNPIYHIRLMVAEWQVSRYEAAKEKKALLEFRLIHLRNQLEDSGESNPRLEKEITYTQGRVDKLDAYMRDFEEDIGGYQ